MSHYETAVRLRPGFAEAHFNLAVALANLGQIDEAVRQFRRTIESSGLTLPMAHADDLEVA